LRRTIVLLAVLASLPLAPSAFAETPEIVGGRDATRPYPFAASLQMNDGRHFCGGSLVRAQWILTAKHCVRNRQPSSFQVMLGSPRRSQPGTIHRIEQVIVDPNADSDSAVLKLAVPSTLELAGIADPSTKSEWSPGDVATAIGWGTTCFLACGTTDYLQEVEVHVVSDDDCQLPYPGFNRTMEICAGELTGGKDTCQGDSGGPLMVPDPNAAGKWLVFGTTWYGNGCGFPLFYGVYAKVGEGPTHDWVNSVLPPLETAAAA
jgi:secreted trypsin-like serine protease